MYLDSYKIQRSSNPRGHNISHKNDPTPQPLNQMSFFVGVGAFFVLLGLNPFCHAMAL